MTTLETSVADPPDAASAEKPAASVRSAPSPRGPRPPLPLLPELALWVAATVTLVALWLVAFALYFSALQQHSAQARLYDDLREQLAGGDTPPPLGGAIRPGAPVAVLQIPAIGLSQVVVQATTSRQMSAGPGHRSDTPLPGQPGVSVVMGRSVMFGAPFARLPQLRPGQTITAVTGQGTFHFRVLAVRRPGDSLPARLPAGGSRLTLVTTEGSGWRSGWAPQSVVAVDADLVGQPQPAPPGRPAAAGRDESALSSSTADLPVLVLWLQGLLLVVGATTWAALRWGRWQAWLVGAPLVLATVWGATAAAFTMVPNLL